MVRLYSGIIPAQVRVQSFCLLVFIMAKTSLYGYQQGMASSFAMRLYRFYIPPRRLWGSSRSLWTVNNLLVCQFRKVEMAQQSCRHHTSPTMFYTCQLYITKYSSVLCTRVEARFSVNSTTVANQVRSGNLLIQVSLYCTTCIQYITLFCSYRFHVLTWVTTQRTSSRNWSHTSLL